MRSALKAMSGRFFSTSAHEQYLQPVFKNVNHATLKNGKSHPLAAVQWAMDLYRKLNNTDYMALREVFKSHRNPDLLVARHANSNPLLLGIINQTGERRGRLTDLARDVLDAALLGSEDGVSLTSPFKDLTAVHTPTPVTTLTDTCFILKRR